MPRTAICGCIQGIYNLLPLRTLDGGQALGKLLEATCPEYTQKVMTAVEIVTVFLLILTVLYVTADAVVHVLAATVWLVVHFHFDLISFLGMISVFPAMLCFIPLQRKEPICRSL
jgi:Zn-dependent protease